MPEPDNAPPPSAPSSAARSIPETARDWLTAGRSVALATVIETWGSAPRPAGSHLVIDQDGNFEGSVSGGCVEGAVVAEALEVIETGRCRLLEFGVADETAWRVGLSCGGRITVFVQRLGEGFSHDDLIRLADAARDRKSAVARIDLTNGATAVSVEGEEGLRDDGRLARREGNLFVSPYRPAPRLVVIGAVHISQALAPMAALAGFAVTIIDPRSAFATPERFVGIDLVADWPDDVLAGRPLDRHTALVAVTHDPKIDDPALTLALRAGCFYIGALGSRKTHAARVLRLQASGFATGEIDQIAAPIGLPIGAATPAEIAVAILAQLIATLRSPAEAARVGSAP